MALERGNLEDSFLTVAEVAEMLKLNQQTVRNWIDQGSLPALRVGRRVRIRRSDLERLLEEGSTAGTGSSGQDSSPSAEDFWGGEPVGLAEESRMDDPEQLATEEDRAQGANEDDPAPAANGHDPQGGAR
jgi:excisionase family DNA binding protein